MRTQAVMAVALAAFFWSAGAVAAPTDGERAAELKRQGDAALEELHAADALEAYNAALAITNDPAIVFNRGRALQALARYTEALSAFEAFQHDAPPDLISKVPGLPDLIADVR